MSNLRAFKLSDDYSLESLNGATISFGPTAQMLDIKQALDAGDGVIVADDPTLIDALRASGALVDADIPEDASLTEVNVEIPKPVAAGQQQYEPQGTPPSLIPGVDLPPTAAAVHAPEPVTVEEAAQQPQSQAQAQGAPDESGPTTGTDGGTADANAEANTGETETPPRRFGKGV